jgi:hypothetical protein
LFPKVSPQKIITKTERTLFNGKKCSLRLSPQKPQLAPRSGQSFEGAWGNLFPKVSPQKIITKTERTLFNGKKGSLRLSSQKPQLAPRSGQSFEGA